MTQIQSAKKRDDVEKMIFYETHLEKISL